MLFLALLKKFVRSIHLNEPQTYYEAYRRGSTLDFVHIMKFPDDKAEDKHAGSSYTDEFVKVLYPHCVKRPVFTELSGMK